ncbi:hypothetical protein [Modestobacter lapidis]|nr:hypothetical protein [Modestobacter lapidis]
MSDMQERIFGDILRAYPDVEPYEMRQILRTSDFLGHHSRGPDGIDCFCGWRRTSLGADWEVHLAAELMTQRPWEKKPSARPATDG